MIRPVPVVVLVLVLATAASVRAARTATAARPVRGRLSQGPVSRPPAARVRVPALFTRRLEAALRSADLAHDAAGVARRWVGGAVAGVVVGGAMWGPGGSLVVLAVAAGGPVALLAWRKGRQGQRFSAALPGLLEAVAGSLRAGSSLPEALSSAAADATGSALLDGDLAALTARVGRGQPFVDAVRSWTVGRPHEGVGLVAAAFVLGTEAGGARARAIDGVAATLRDRRALTAEVDALSAQARASAVVMMGAPVVFAALGLLSDPDVSAFLLRTPAGLGCLLVGLGLDVAAGLWMMRIARAAA